MFKRFIRSFAIAALALPALVAFPNQPFAQTADAPRPGDQAELAKPNPLGEMAIGSATAPVTIIQYSSLKCHRCRTYITVSLPEVRARYVATGKVRYILREFPFDLIDAAAFLLARCVAKGDSDKYFATLTTLIVQQEAWNVAKPLQPLRDIMIKAGLSEAEFNACLSDKDTVGKIGASTGQIMERLGLKGEDLPALFINGQRHQYIITPLVDEMGRKIDAIIKSQ